MKIGVFTSICEADARWFSQYLEEMDRLELDFALNFDRCSEETKRLFTRHPRFIGATYQDDPKIEFTEQHKQGCFDIVRTLGYDWALATDVDETYERLAPEKLAKLVGLKEIDWVDTIWHNLWEESTKIRIDGTFGGGHRVKLYNLQEGRRWYFDGKITNGCKLVDDKRIPLETRGTKLDLVCLHWGMMTEELREEHKARWDRIYGAAVGNNPYGFWNYALDKSITPQLAENTYL